MHPSHRADPRDRNVHLLQVELVSDGLGEDRRLKGLEEDAAIVRTQYWYKFPNASNRKGTCLHAPKATSAPGRET